MPTFFNASASKAAEVDSPVASKLGKTDLQGRAQIFSARRINSSVVSPNAETTAITCAPSRHQR
jgi:hypothetical protein